MAKEIKRKIVQYQIDMICECGGKFFPTDVIVDLFSRTIDNKLHIKHKCNKCGKEEKFETAYPTTETILEEI